VIHPCANADGTQRTENTGPLKVKRMETLDEANVTPKGKCNRARAVLCWTIGEFSPASVTLGG